MNLLKLLWLDIIILLFPFLIYLIYLTYTQCANKERRELFLDFSLLSSLYFLFSFQGEIPYNVFLILANAPLLLAYLKKRGFAGIMISLLILCYYYSLHDKTILLFLSFQYLLFYLMYCYQFRKRKNSLHYVRMFLFIKLLFSCFLIIKFELFTLANISLQVIGFLIFLLFSYLLIYIVKKGEDIISLHISMQKLKTETEYRTSLFKITHEIKNPIAVCKSYLDMFDFDNPEHRRYIPIVKEEIQKILLLLQDFLAMNKIKIKKEVLDMTMLLEEVIEQYAPILKDNNIAFHYEILDDELYIEGDYNRLMQVMINIIKNAMEAKGENPLSFTLKSERKKDQLILQMMDTGVGFSMEEFDKIKEPFYTTKKNGTGLGVSLSYEIISAHNGTIAYESKLGKGTTVTITLPLVILS